MNSLVRELAARGHNVDTVEMPLTMLPKERLLSYAAMWRSLDLTSFGSCEVDLVIATKFPTYYAKHPRKSLWLVHQHRPAYELYGGRFSDLSDDPRDEAFRRMVYEGDNKVIRECGYVSGISRNVIDRLKLYNEISGDVLYPPLPLAGRYRSSPESENFILSVGRICTIKRVDLMLKALPMVHAHVKLKIAGVPDEPGIMDYFTNEIAKHHLQHRVEFLGRVDDEQLLDIYSRALAVYYAPYNEDYGYVTLEAMASGRPVITAHDSGGTLEFVRHEVNGLICDPTTDGIAAAANRIIENPGYDRVLGEAGKKFIEESGLGAAAWDTVIAKLLSPLQGALSNAA